MLPHEDVPFAPSADCGGGGRIGGGGVAGPFGVDGGPPAAADALASAFALLREPNDHARFTMLMAAGAAGD